MRSLDFSMMTPGDWPEEPEMPTGLSRRQMDELSGLSHILAVQGPLFVVFRWATQIMADCTELNYIEYEQESTAHEHREYLKGLDEAIREALQNGEIDKVEAHRLEQQAENDWQTYLDEVHSTRASGQVAPSTAPSLPNERLIANEQIAGTLDVGSYMPPVQDFHGGKYAPYDQQSIRRMIPFHPLLGPTSEN